MLKKSQKTHLDWQYFTVLMLLLVFGIIMVYDSSVVTAAGVFGGKYHFLFLQFFWVILGLIAFGVASLFDLKFLATISKPLLVVAVIFLILVLLPIPFSEAIYGAKRWFYFNPAPLPMIPFFGRLGFQPAELAKLALVIFLSGLLAKKPTNYKITYFGVTALVLLLVGCEPDFGTLLVLGGIAVSLFFAMGGSLWYFVAGLPAAFVAALVYILSSDYRKERLLTFLGKGSNEASSYHIQQILIALGSGGLTGLGLGQSRQKYGFVPEVQTDSILAIVGEELGLLGTVALTLLFLILVWRGFKIASNCKGLYERGLVIGIMSWLAMQVLVNMAAMTHLIPLTGVPLPLISYGGSAMVFIMAGLGLVFNVSRRGDS